MSDIASQAPACTDSLPSRILGYLSARVVLVVALYAAAVYLPFLGSVRPLTRHEVFITQPALQMVSEGNWLVPHYANRVWIQKPPLVSWMTAGLFMAAGGFHEWAARLPAALSAVGLSVLIAVVTRRFYGDGPALFAGLVQATCVYMYRQGRLGEVDLPFAFFLAIAFCVLAWYWGQGLVRLPLRWAVVFHAMAGLATMTKGPLAVILLGVTVLLFCAVRRSLRPLLAVLWTPAILAFLAVVMPWYIAVGARLSPADLHTWTLDSLGRFSGEHHLGVQPFYMYIYTVPWVMLPWSVVLAVGSRRLYVAARRPEAVLDRFLWCWFFGGLLFLSLCAFKHHHYCIPILPPLSIFAGRLLAEHALRLGQGGRRLYIGVFASIVIVLGAISAVVIPYSERGTRQMTVFLRHAVAVVPPDAPVHVVGLGESGAYPYIGHLCDFPRTLKDVQPASNVQAAPVWVLTVREHVSSIERLGWTFGEVAAEPVGKGHASSEALVLGRVYGSAGGGSDR
jgi:4-amino-4-deoxy-L-arabinose transferase-like glycosyltransferase